MEAGGGKVGGRRGRGRGGNSSLPLTRGLLSVPSLFLFLCPSSLSSPSSPHGEGHLLYTHTHTFVIFTLYLPLHLYATFLFCCIYPTHFHFALYLHTHLHTLPLPPYLVPRRPHYLTPQTLPGFQATPYPACCLPGTLQSACLSALLRFFALRSSACLPRVPSALVARFLTFTACHG